MIDKNIAERTEQMLREAAKEGREDYAMTICDAVYDAFVRNPEMKENTKENRAWRYENLYTIYPKAWLIRAENQDNGLSEREIEAGRVICEEVIHAYQETAKKEKETGESYPNDHIREDFAEKFYEAIGFSIDEEASTIQESDFKKGETVYMQMIFRRICDLLDPIKKESVQRVFDSYNSLYKEQRNWIKGKTRPGGEYDKRYPLKEFEREIDNPTKYPATLEFSLKRNLDELLKRKAKEVAIAIFKSANPDLVDKLDEEIESTDFYWERKQS